MGLKRRTGRFAPAATQSSVLDSVDDDDPPTKKYKDLYDASDPDRIAQYDMDGYRNAFSQLPASDGLRTTQSAAMGPPALPAVAEEEEESTQTQARDRLQALKRKARTEDGDVEMRDGEEEPRASKKRAVDVPNAVQPTPKLQVPPASGSKVPPASKASKTTSSKTQAGKDQATNGVASGQLDTDDAFLKAIASTKRGKKLEDTFDVEFNNLRISKPDLRRQQADEEWKILDDFGEDQNLRGNFMVVVEMDLYKKPTTSHDAMRVTGGRADWEGRPDFKKFKQAS